MYVTVEDLRATVIAFRSYYEDYIRTLPDEKLVQINKRLNEEQQMAVRAVLNKVDESGPYIIYGPPGTGKTVTVSFL